jgi:hypothetical protein
MPTHGRWLERFAWLALVATLLAFLPLFLCEPLWCDVTLFDLCARTVLRGGVHYRDALEINFPGALWLHLLFRSLAGWSSVALRAIDVAVVAATAGLLVRLPFVAVRGRAVQVTTATGMLLCYFATPEICHCQRDGWALFFAVAALSLRCRDLRGAGTILEGLLWGAACWIKPFVAVAALGAWLGHSRTAGFREAVRRDLGVLAGGMLALALGGAWLWTSGTWPHFRNVLTHWLPAYQTAYLPDPGHRWVVLESFVKRFRPWSWLTLAAIAPALLWLICGGTEARSRRVYAGFFLGWLAQMVFVQVPHPYTVTPLLLLALPVFASVLPPPSPPLRGRGAGGEGVGELREPHPQPLPETGRGEGATLFGWLPLAAVLVFSGMALSRHPLLKPERLALWPRCWTEGSTDTVKDRLTLFPHFGATSWQDLELVAEFLRGQDVRDGDVMCFHCSVHPLLLRLDIAPPNPLVATNPFHSPVHTREVLDMLAASTPRFLVGDAKTLEDAQAEDIRTSAIENRKSKIENLQSLSPWNEPIVFRAGRYIVYRRTQPIGRYWFVD